MLAGIRPSTSSGSVCVRINPRLTASSQTREPLEFVTLKLTIRPSAAVLTSTSQGRFRRGKLVAEKTMFARTTRAIRAE